MKSIYSYLPVILIAMYLSACINEGIEPVTTGNGSEVEVSLHVSMPIDEIPIPNPETRSLTGIQENMIQSIDVLSFRINPDNTEDFVYYTAGKLLSGAGTSKQTFLAKVKITPYKQRFVVITNARDEVMKLIGSVEWAKTPKDGMLKMLEFTNRASDHKWNVSDPARYIPFPMWGEMQIPQVITPSSTSIDGIPMLRMVAKIDVVIAESDAVSGKNPRDNFKLTEVYLYNTKDKGHIVPDRNTLVFSTPGNLIVNKPTIPSVPNNWKGPLKYTSSNETSLINEVYTLEAKAADLATNPLDATGLVIGGYYSKDGINWDKTPSYYRLDIMTTDKTTTRDILRNHNYLLNITQVNGPGNPSVEIAWNSKVPIDMMVAEWSVQAVPGDMNKRQLNTSVAKVTITGITSSRIYFWSDQPTVKVEETGYTGASGTIPFSVNHFFDDLAVTGAATTTSMFQYDPQSGEGYMDIATISAKELSSDVRRIYLNAGGLRREIIVNTTITSSPRLFGDFPWVGTFHRSNEVGERVIYSDHVGKWSARVEDPQGKGSFVVLSKIPGNNTNLRTESPGNAEDYPVVNGVKSVNGNDRIFFRVGMTSVYRPTAAAPARYAKIIVKYSGGEATIYVRQGEEADYLMRNGDAPTGNSDISARQRTLARKFSPYNLTDAKGRPDRVGEISGTKYVFTDYPSQAGYYFQWDKTYAWYPDGLSSIDWIRTNNSGLWEPNKALYESCPPGYHRPADGSTSAYVTLPKAKESEIRQSLYLNPRDATPGSGEFRIWGHEDSANSMWGYYADGFFDRRPTRSSISGEKFTVVASGAQLAYIGRLFYNPYTNASLFFPASGIRYDGVLLDIPKGRIESAGSRAYFWTTTKYSSAYPIYQSASPNRSIIVDTGNLMGMPIRCMKNQ